MSTITLDASNINLILLLTLICFVAVNWIWSYFYGEKTKLELNKGLNTLKTMEPRIKKQMKDAIATAVEELDWYEILGEIEPESSGLTGLIGQLLPHIIQQWQQQGGDELVAQGAEVAMKAAADVVKDVASSPKK